MNWFLAKIVFHIICGDGKHTPQFDEQLRLVEADNELQAIHQARLHGENEQVSFFNDRQKLVQWKFIGVSEIQQMPGLIDGAEIYSHIHEADDETEYLEMIRLKNHDLLCEMMKRSFLQKPVFPLVASVENCIGKIV